MRGEEPGSGEISPEEAIGILATALLALVFKEPNLSLRLRFGGHTDVSIASTTHLHFAFGVHGIHPTCFPLNCNNTVKW